jgi:2-polyprenyl-3-methyl-5-hydroxy-6-metoxy-1,4-benzoquinol methylase
MDELNHVYERKLNPDGQDSLAKLARLIAPGSKVLDVGCGPGVLGEYLTRERGCIVDGVEIFAEAARIAARSFHEVIVADLETFVFDPLRGRSYDYVVCADVLEHLRNGAFVARQLPPLLAPNGRVLLSIPNVAYAGLIAALINGEFRYRGEGLLDSTHLRFFTRQSLVEWLADVGLQASTIDTVRVDLVDSEFGREGLEAFAPALREQLLSSEDALTYQFIVDCLPAGAAIASLPPRPTPPATVTFLTQLYWRANGAAYAEERSAFARPSMGVDPQRISFTLPPLSEGDIELRLDVADRPGFLRLYDVAVFDADGQCLWRWDGSRAQLDRMPSNELTLVDDPARGQLMVTTGNDPWIELPFHDDGERLARGGRVEVDLAWPMSSDARAVTERLSRDSIGATLAAEERRRQEVVQELATMRAEQRRSIVERDRLERERAFLEHERARLTGELDHLRHRQADLVKESDELRHETARLKATLEEVNQSITFRIARPVFSVVNRVRDLRKRLP